MDRLAAEGVRFANAYCTNSLCAPSRASVFDRMLFPRTRHSAAIPKRPTRWKRSTRRCPRSPSCCGRPATGRASPANGICARRPRDSTSGKILPGQGSLFRSGFHRRQRDRETLRVRHRQSRPTSRWTSCGAGRTARSASSISTRRRIGRSPSRAAPREFVQRHRLAAPGNVRRRLRHPPGRRGSRGHALRSQLGRGLRRSARESQPGRQAGMDFSTVRERPSPRGLRRR